MNKAHFREAALARRRKMSPEERRLRGEAVAERFLSLGLVRPGATLCLYLATAEEVETRSLVAHAFEVGCRVVLPRAATDGHLELFPVESLSTHVVPGAFGIDEPCEGIAPPIEPEAVDVFVVPGVAFDASGRRCGFGRGYYDRLLARRAPGALIVALAFECQLQPTLPAEESDVRMDIICTEKRVLDCRERSIGPRVESQPATGKEVDNPWAR